GIFVATLWSEVEEVVGAEENIQAAAIGRIGMEDFSNCVLVKNAEAGSFFAGKFSLTVVVVDLAFGHFVFSKRNVIVVVEVVAVGGDPLEVPAHALLESLDCGIGARETAEDETSRALRCTRVPSK